MQYAPTSFKPGTITIQNGRPTHAGDAAFVDTYTTWLAAANPWPVPVMAGSPLTSTNAPAATPNKFDVWIPAYCQHVAVRLIATGQGEVVIAANCDANSITIPVGADDAGTGDFANYVIVNSDAPQSPATVVANGLNRAINVDTPQSSPRRIDVTVYVTNAAGKTLKVWAVQLIPLLPLETAVLVA